MFGRSMTFALAFAGMTFAGTARADLPPSEDVEVCSGSKAGDACEAEGKSGKCVTHSCSRLDYSGGTPPESVSYDCLRCDESGAAAPEPEASPDPKANPTPVETPAEKGTPEVPVESKGACSVVVEGGPAPLALVLLALVRRRRRR
jgi:MYXO-CTERM domain-containing protein